MIAAETSPRYRPVNDPLLLPRPKIAHAFHPKDFTSWRKDNVADTFHPAQNTTMADDADRSLVHYLQLRQRAAWAHAYDSHASDVFNFIAHLLPGDRAAAEEIHQETWLAALAGIDAFDVGRGELRGWIFGIARRQVALHFRRLGQNRLEALGGDDAAAWIDDDSLLPRDVIGAIERADAVRAALAELGAEARGVLLAKYIDRRSVNQLAQQFGRSPKAIESLLSRARVRMRQLLAWYFDTESATKDVHP